MKLRHRQTIPTRYLFVRPFPLDVLKHLSDLHHARYLRGLNRNYSHRRLKHLGSKAAKAREAYIMSDTIRSVFSPDLR